MPFHEIKIPLDHTSNIIARAISEKQPQQTNDWQYLFTPALSKKDAHMNQAGAGVESSVVYPLDVPHGGALIFSLYQPLDLLTQKHHNFMKHYASFVSQQLNQLTPEQLQ